MVLVLHHILIAVVQFLRRGQQVFLKPDEPPPPPPCADSLQVGGLPVLGTRSRGCLAELGRVFRRACSRGLHGLPCPWDPSPSSESHSRAYCSPSLEPLKHTLTVQTSP